MEEGLIEEISRHLIQRGFLVRKHTLVIPGKSQYGEMDLWATKGSTIYEVECKFINRTNPTQKRKKVKEQALNYASILKWKYPDKSVFAFACTNEGLQKLGEVGPERALLWFQHVGLTAANLRPPRR